MRTIKPVCCSLLTRCIEHRRQYYLNVSVLAHVPLIGGVYLGSEQTLWPMLAEYAPGFTEESVSRMQSEFLLYGNAYPNVHSGNVASVDIGIRIGNLAKKARVFGRRAKWSNRLQVQDPVGITAIIPEHSYGGPDYPDNPVGTGHPSSEKEGVLELPRIEPLTHPWHPEVSMNRPVFFGQLDIMHPQRQRMAGTYGDDWLKTLYPGMPEDADWRIFNTTMPDQQQAAPFAGNESYDLVNLSATASHINNRLPGIGARVLVQFKQQTAFHDLKTGLRSLLFLPEANALVMIWQTQCQVKTDDARDVGLILAAFEHLHNPKETGHYQRTVARYMDKDDGKYASLDESPLLPENMPHAGLLDGMPDLNQPPAEDSAGERQKRKAEKMFQAARAEAEAHGMDPDEHAPAATFPEPEPYPPVPELGAFIRKKSEEAERVFQQTEAYQQQLIAETEEECRHSGVDFDLVREEMAGNAPGSNVVGPPKGYQQENLRILRETNAQAIEYAGGPVEEIEEMLADEKLQAQWEQSDSDALDLYRMSAQYQQPFSPLQDEAALAKREMVEERLRQGLGIEEMDLTGADLSGMDLSGVNARRALMESVILTHANLSGADLSGAVLAHADLSFANLQRCVFEAANLGKALLTEVNAEQAVFSHAILEGTGFKGAKLQAAKFCESQWLKLDLSRCELQGSTFRKSSFIECDFSGSLLNEAVLDDANFVKCLFAGSSWRGCKGKKVAFIEMKNPGADFSSCELPESIWAEAVDLSHASFKGAVLDRAYFAQDSLLTDVDFTSVHATQTDFTACRLIRAVVRDAVLKNASLRNANLQGADLSHSDLMHASLQNANLSGCRLIETHLFGADLARIQTDRYTQASGAQYGKARVYPRLSPAGSG